MLDPVRQIRIGSPLATPAAESQSLDANGKKLSVSKCRELLGSKMQLDNERIEALRDQLYALADVLTSEFLKRKATSEGTVQ